MPTVSHSLHISVHFPAFFRLQFFPFSRPIFFFLLSCCFVHHLFSVDRPAPSASFSGDRIRNDAFSQVPKHEYAGETGDRFRDRESEPDICESEEGHQPGDGDHQDDLAHDRQEHTGASEADGLA